jgi:membrane protease YdiL (CAAX protease family)
MRVEREVTMNDEPSTHGPSGATLPANVPALTAKGAVWIFAVFLGVQVLVVVPGAFSAGMRSALDGDQGLQMNAGLLLFLTVLGTAWGGFVALWMARRRLPGAMAVIGWAPAPIRTCGLAALQGIGLVVSFGVANALLPLPPPGPGPFGRLEDLGLGAKVAGVVFAVAVAPPVEELVFRGVLYAGLAGRWGAPKAAAWTTLAFVLMHVPQIGGFWPGWIIIGLVGVLALRARLRSGSLLPAVALHVAYNLGLVLVEVAAAAAGK